MPLAHQINKIDFSILIWQIDETEEQLKKNIILHSSDSTKLNQLKHSNKRREFLALRQCLRSYFGNNPEVFYSPEGKPYLKQNTKISFTHTHDFAAIIVSRKLEIGIDLEILRDSMKRVAPKFMNESEFKSLEKEREVEHLTQYWGAKEVIVKIEGNRRLDFKKDIVISPFLYQPDQKTKACLLNHGQPKTYELRFSYLEPLTLTYGWLEE